MTQLVIRFRQTVLYVTGITFLYDSYEMAYFDQIKSVLKPRMKLFNRGRNPRLSLKYGIKLWFLIDLFDTISVGKVPLNSIT